MYDQNLLKFIISVGKACAGKPIMFQRPKPLEQKGNRLIPAVGDGDEDAHFGYVWILFKMYSLIIFVFHLFYP
jgi:hypothetical protein